MTSIINNSEIHNRKEAPVNEMTEEVNKKGTNESLICILLRHKLV